MGPGPISVGAAARMPIPDLSWITDSLPGRELVGQVEGNRACSSLGSVVRACGTVRSLVQVAPSALGAGESFASFAATIVAAAILCAYL